MKRILVIILLVVIVSSVYTCVFARFDDGPGLEDFKPSQPNSTDIGNTTLATKTKDIWATVVVLVQITSVATVVFAGLRYMFASADQKADIKQGLIYLTIGAVLVFGATTIISAVGTAADKVLK